MQVKKKTLLCLEQKKNYQKKWKNKMIQYESTNKINKLNAKFANEFVWF